ncbi:MAG: hypothetical protein AB8I58_04060, partial [Anaerolineales bacterium]
GFNNQTLAITKSREEVRKMGCGAGVRRLRTPFFGYPFNIREVLKLHLKCNLLHGFSSNIPEQEPRSTG